MKWIFFLYIAFLFACDTPSKNLDSKTSSLVESDTTVVSNPLPAANNVADYLSLLEGKKVALVVNQTSRVNDTHLADTLLALGVEIIKIFAPEHGFRGTADAGETIKDGVDTATGLPVISLYGKNKKPSATQLSNVEAVVFDIQDVGVRFYTYISTMHYVMEACAENNKAFIVLDRPNPNGFYVDGPVLDTAFQSFVGMHPIPVVHGLTVGELAQMINKEGWLSGRLVVDLTVVPCQNYTHTDVYSLPIKPSPNLPNDRAVALYPSLCFFEPTLVSVGRGTATPFQIIGSPMHKEHYTFQFTPTSTAGAKYPKHENITCFGKDFTQNNSHQQPFFLEELIEFYALTEDKSAFFTNAEFFDLLAGSKQLRMQIINQIPISEIRKSWQADLNSYQQMRKKYLLYQ